MIGYLKFLEMIRQNIIIGFLLILSLLAALGFLGLGRIWVSGVVGALASLFTRLGLRDSLIQFAHLG